jgi:hypothetical protein
MALLQANDFEHIGQTVADLLPGVVVRERECEAPVGAADAGGDNEPAHTLRMHDFVLPIDTSRATFVTDVANSMECVRRNWPGGGSGAGLISTCAGGCCAACCNNGKWTVAKWCCSRNKFGTRSLHCGHDNI